MSELHRDAFLVLLDFDFSSGLDLFGFESLRVDGDVADCEVRRGVEDDLFCFFNNVEATLKVFS